MAAINGISLTVCLVVFNRVRREAGGFSRMTDAYPKYMLIMGLIFTVVATYRSIFVSRCLYQFAWFDLLANSSRLIRFSATFAELSFAGLFTYAMLRFNEDMPSKKQQNPLLHFISTKSPYLLFTCLLIAPFFLQQAQP